MFEEVKEMIDSTIYTNGRGEVTAQNVNLAMQAIVDATEEGLAEVEKKIGESCSGSGALRVWVYYDDISELTSDQIAENVETYKTICKGEHSTVTLCVSGNGGGAEGFITISPTQILAFRLVGEETYDVGIYYEGIDYMNGKRELVTIALNPDGSQDAYYWEEPAPASSGPTIVYMGIMEETEEGVTFSLTEEEKAHNAEVFNTIRDSKCQISVLIDATRMTYHLAADEGVILPEDASFSATYSVWLLGYLPHIEGVFYEMIQLLVNAIGYMALLPDGTLTADV